MTENKDVLSFDPRAWDVDLRPISIKPSSPVKITIDYAWIGNEIRNRIGYLPDDIERVLMELAKEQHN